MPEPIRPSHIFPDPVLTQWVVAYGTGPGLVQDRIAPVVSVSNPEFKYATYAADQLNLEVETRVIPGDAPNLVRRAKPTFLTGTCGRNALDDQLTEELIRSAPNPIVLEQNRTLKLAHELKLGVEARLKALLDTAGTAETAPSTKWDATSGTIKIEQAFDSATETFVKKCGFEPNLAIIPPAVAKVMKRDSAIRDLRKSTDPTLLVNGGLPSILWGLPIIIPGALANTGNPLASFAQTIDRVWSTDTVYLLYVEPMADTQTMNSIAQYRWSQYGPAYAAYRWTDPHQSKRLRWISVDNYQVEKVVCNDAIVRIPDVLT